MLIWVSGQFVFAVSSTFITRVRSQLQPDSGDKTAALLRVLIYKIADNAFGNDIPTLPIG